jgi:hypothetical protein
MDNFDALVVHVKSICRNANREFAGALLRPHAGALDAMVKAGIALDVIDAAKDAGRQLAGTGNIKQVTLDKVSRELLPMDMYMKAANRGFQQMLDARARDLPENS